MYIAADESSESNLVDVLNCRGCMKNSVDKVGIPCPMPFQALTFLDIKHFIVFGVLFGVITVITLNLSPPPQKSTYVSAIKPFTRLNYSVDA